MKNYILIFSLLLFSNNLVTAKKFYTVTYSCSLSAVELSINSQTLENNHNIEEKSSETFPSYIYEDESFVFTWKVNLTRLSFNIENKTKETVKIDWNNVIFVDCYNLVNNVMPKGAKYINHDKSFSPTIILKGTTYEGIIIPSNNVVLNAAVEWTELFLIPCVYTEEVYREELAPRFLGKKMRVLMPIMVGNKQYEYCFYFTIDKIINKGETSASGGKAKRIEKYLGSKIVK